MHMLLWLRDLRSIDLSKVRASILFGRPDEAFLVADLQSSSQTVLPTNSAATRVVAMSNQQYIEFHYSAMDRARKICAYVTTLLGSLHYRVNLQSSDGKGMLLKYVSSYVSKCHGAACCQQLYSPDLQS